MGEAFRQLVSPTVVRASYAVAFGYVFLDVIDKTKKKYAQASRLSPDSATSRAAAVGVDCFVWQTFASVLIPGFTINRICKLSSLVINKSNMAPLMRANKAITTVIGLASIPLIIHPIDHLCHVVMDKTLRPFLAIEPHVKDE